MPNQAATKDTFISESKRVLYAYGVIAFAILVVFGVLHVLFENQLLGWLELAGSVAVFGVVAGLKLTGNVKLTRTLLLLCMLSMLIVMLITGGTEGTGIFWVFIFPVSAFFLTNKIAGAWWVAVLAGIILTIMVLAEFSFIITPYSTVDLRQVLISLLVVAVGIYIYQQSRERLALETKQSNTTSREEKLRADIIVDNIDEGVVAVDDKGRILRVNRAAQKMLGWAADELVGHTFTSMVPMLDKLGRHISDQQRPLSHTLQTGEHMQVEAIYLCKNGSPLSAAMNNRAVVVDGKVHGAVTTFRDTSQENAIDRAKSEFVTLASHQLRTPISAIAWVSELLLHGDAGSLKPDQIGYVKQIYKSNKRMAALVDAMLTASSLELNSLPVRPELVDLAKISREVLQDRLDTLAADKILHIKEEYDPTLKPVMFDPSITRTILQNLIANAFKYTLTNGKVTVTIKPDGAFILMRVADTGLGIPSNQQGRIFTRLFRAENIKDKDTDGTGLGLYIVKTVTEYVGGHMSFTSVEGKGSVFSVYLPREGMPKKEVESHNHPGQNKRVSKKQRSR